MQPQYTQEHIDHRDLRIGRLILQLELFQSRAAELSSQVITIQETVTARDERIRELEEILAGLADDDEDAAEEDDDDAD